MESILPGLASTNMHPMVVHFPIAFWLAAAGIWALAFVKKNDTIWRFGLWTQTAGLVAAALAIALGYYATDQMGHDSPGHGMVHVHRDFMLATSAIAALVTAIGWWKRDGDNRWRAGLVVGSVVVISVMTLGADRGAELVYRYGVGVANEKPPEGAAHSHGEGGHDEGGGHDEVEGHGNKADDHGKAEHHAPGNAGEPGHHDKADTGHHAPGDEGEPGHHDPKADAGHHAPGDEGEPGHHDGDEASPGQKAAQPHGDHKH